MGLASRVTAGTCSGKSGKSLWLLQRGPLCVDLCGCCKLLQLALGPGNISRQIGGGGSLPPSGGGTCPVDRRGPEEYIATYLST